MKLLFSVHLSLLQSCSSRFLVGFVDCSLFFISIMKLHYLTSKNWKPNFRRNFVFASIWAKSFLFLKTLSFYFLVNILKGELFWCLTFHPNSLVSESSRSWVITKMSSQLIRLWDYWKSNIYWTLVNRGSYEITVACLSCTLLIGQFNIFLGSRWIDFLDFLWGCIISASTNLQSKICRNFIFGCYWPKRTFYI